jgi:hypothetical protein
MNNIPVLSDLNDHQLVVMLVLNALPMLYGLVKVRSADQNARQAKNQTVATGNGFAEEVKGELAHIRLEQVEQREQLKFATTYIQRVDQRQQAHMEYHVRESR